MKNRRTFLRQTLLGSALALSLPDMAFSAAPQKGKKIRLKEGQTVLFQGDSITDAGRDKNSQDKNNAATLGSGYSLLAGSQLLLNKASLNLSVYNKGISGNKVYQLAERWDADALNLKPDVLSILIGVNDFWHTLAKENPYKGTVKTYEDDYRKLLQQTKQALPDVRFIIGEPFTLKGLKAVDNSWFPKFDDYRNVSRKLAEEFDAVFIPYQQVFDEAVKQAPAAYWSNDGVHTTLAGSALMASAWLKAFQ